MRLTILFSGDAVLEYLALCFNADHYLVGLSGVPDYKLVLWNWKKGVRLHSISTSIRNATTLSFCAGNNPKSPKLLLTETVDGPLSVWKIKRCGEDIRLDEQTITREAEILNQHLTATWAYPNYMYILTKMGTIFRVNHEKGTTSALLLTKEIEQYLQPPVKTNTFLRPHFDGLVVVSPKIVLLMRVAGEIGHTSLMKKVDLLQPVLNLADFYNSYRYIGWTPTGNILNLQVTDNNIHQQLVWSKTDKRKYLAAGFLQPESSHFVALDNTNTLQIFSVHSKEEVLRKTFPMECKFLLTHPKLPIVFVLTADGRVLVVVVVIKILPPKSKEIEEFSGDEEAEITGKDVSLEVKACLFQETRVQSHPLDFGEFDNSANFVVMGGKDHNKVFLCEIQSNLKPAGGGTFMKGPNKRKKGFQPSFDAPGGTAPQKSVEEQEIVKEDVPPEDDSKYFKTCHAARFEGVLLDLSFVNKTLVCLTSTPSDEPGNVNESERIRYSGDQVTIFSVDKAAKTIQISSIVMLKGRCSGTKVVSH